MLTLRSFARATATTLTAVTLAAAAACEPPASPNGPATYFTLRTEGKAVQLRLDGDRLYGPSTDISRVGEGEYRGRWKDQLADLRSKGGVIEGTIASMRTELHATRGEQGLAAQGLVAGILCNIQVTPAAYKGVVGACTYDLTKQPDGTYGGRRACGQTFSYSTLELPRTFDQLAPEEAALYLAMVTAS